MDVIEIQGYALPNHGMTSGQKDAFIKAIEYSGLAKHLTGNVNHYRSGSLIINRSNTIPNVGYAVQESSSLTYDFLGFIHYLISLPPLKTISFDGNFEVRITLANSNLVQVTKIKIRNSKVSGSMSFEDV